MRRNIKRLEHQKYVLNYSWPEEMLQRQRQEANQPIHSAEFWSVPKQAWPQIARLPSLNSLTFVGTDLRGKPMETISRLKNLRRLHMTDGQCELADLVHLKELPELQHVALDVSISNETQQEWENDYGELTAEEKRRLEEFVSQKPAARQNRSREVMLTALYTDRAIRELVGLKKLRSFKLEGTFVTDAALEVFVEMPELEQLKLSVITSPPVSPHSIGEISTLRSFSQSHADNETLQELSTLSNLEVLEVWADGVTSEGVPHLLKLQNLKWLEIRGNHLDDAGLIQLAQLPKLQYLDIKFAKGPLSLAGVLAFQEKKPDCRLEADNDLPLGLGGERVVVEEEEAIIPPRPRDPADADAPLPLQVSRKNPPDWVIPNRSGGDWNVQVPALLTDNSLLLVGGDGSQFEVLDPANGTIIRKVSVGVRKLSGLQISHDQQRVVYAVRTPVDLFRASRIEVRKLPSLEIVGQPIGHDVNLGEGSLAISPTGESVACGDENGVFVWNVETGKQLKQTPTVHDSVGSLAFSPDGRWLVNSSLGDLSFWKWQTEKDPQTIHVGRHTESLAFTPDSRYLFEGPDSRRDLQVRDMKTMEVVRRLKDDIGHEMHLKNMALTDGGKTLVAGNSILLNRRIIIVNDRLHFWDIETGKILRKLDFTRHVVHSVAVSPNSRYLVAVIKDLGEVLLAGWDLKKLDAEKPD